MRLPFWMAKVLKGKEAVDLKLPRHFEYKGKFRQQLALERQGVKNTYHEDFAFLEVMEPETGVINDAITLANTADGAADLHSQKKVQSPKQSSNQKAQQVSPSNSNQKG